MGRVVIDVSGGKESRDVVYRDGLWVIAEVDECGRVKRRVRLL